MFNSLDSEMFKEGYRVGSVSSLSRTIEEPKGVVGEDLDDWHRGVNAAICDRLG